MFEQWYEPTAEERVILNEMVQKTVESEVYKHIAEKEDIIALEPHIDKNKGGVFPYYFAVSVQTNQQTYLFSCADEKCSQIENSGWVYSIYVKLKKHDCHFSKMNETNNVVRGDIDMKKSTEVTECPKCGGKELGKGIHQGYAVMAPANKMRFGSSVEYTLCTNCGYIIESYVTKPNKFKGTIY